MPRRAGVPSTLKTLRMPIEAVEGLEKAAKERRTNFNALVNRIVERYLKWESIVEEQRMITLSRSAYHAFLDEIDINRLPEIAANGIGVPKEFVLLKYGRLTPETIVSAITDHAKYANQSAALVRTEGDEIIITAHHDHGLKHSILSKELHEKLLQETIGVKPKITITENLVQINIKKPRTANAAS